MNTDFKIPGAPIALIAIAHTSVLVLHTQNFDEEL